jgi:3-oxoacyl-[acyl-carrier-protein] synthase III
VATQPAARSPFLAGPVSPAAPDKNEEIRMLYLNRVAPFVPHDSVAVSDLKERLGLHDSEIRMFTRFLGLGLIATAAEHTLLDMLLEAGESALAGTDRSQVRYVIHAHTMQHVAPPAFRIVDTLCRKLGVDQASAFSISHQNCSAGLYSLKVAESLLQAEEPGARVLVISGEKVSSSVIQKIPGTTLMGEASAACLASLEKPGHGVMGLAYRALGEFNESINMPEPLKQRYQKVYIPTMAEVMKEALRISRVSLDDLSLVLPHNVNRFSWGQLSRYLGLPLDRIYLENVPKIGHCFCADPFINLSTALLEGVIGPGDMVMMVTAGLGATFAAVTVQIGEGGVA